MKKELEEEIRLNYLLNHPNLWEVGKEYDFGDGVYGKRYIGTLTVAANVRNDRIIDSYNNDKKLLNCGGFFGIGNSKTHQVPISFPSCDSKIYHYALLLFGNDNNKSIVLRTSSTNNRVDQNYDIWLTYTKVNTTEKKS